MICTAKVTVSSAVNSSIALRDAMASHPGPDCSRSDFCQLGAPSQPQRSDGFTGLTAVGIRQEEIDISVFP